MGEETTAQAGAETFEFKNPQTNQNVILPKTVGDTDMKSFLEGVIAKSNEFARKKYQGELEQLRGQLSEVDQLKAQLEELQNINLPAKDREAKEYQKNLSKFQQDLEKERAQRTQVESILKAEKLNNALMREAAKYPDIIDIEQTTTLFQAQCSPTLSIDGENVKLSAKLNGEETELSDAFTKWLASDRNANLLKNKLHPGSGSAGGSRASTTTTMTRAQFEALGSAARMDYIAKGGGLKD
jgi:hypothetical protein